MSTPRFYFPNKLELEQSYKLPANLTHYAMRVLRLNNGDEIILFDNFGGQYLAKLDVQGKDFYVAPYQHQAIENELNGKISLFQGLPSGDKMDWIVEKAVELGAYQLYPITTQRSIIKLSPERMTKRLAHWQAIAHAASEQCGRNRIMQVHKPISLGQAMAYKSKLSLFCHPEGEIDLSSQLDMKANEISLFVGPEGGWSDEELAIASKNDLQPIRHGTRILRTETAGIALISACSALMGWNQ